MLILSRRIGEEIVIEGNGRTVIRITQISKDGQHVKLGFEAGKEIVILRAELYNTRAWASTPTALGSAAK